MAEQGGYRKPGAPAPVSGMGSQSRRTDGGPADKQRTRYIANLPYGEGQEFQDIQGSAPMEAAAGAPSASSMGSAPAQLRRQSGPLTPLAAPSAMPGEPVTAGAALGPGPGPEALGIAAQRETQNQAFAAQIAQYMPVLMQVASSPNASAETRDVIRQLRNML